MDTTQPTFTPTNPPQQQYNVFAILGLVFALIFSPVGLIFSIVALKQMRRNPLQKGHGLAAAGVVLSFIVLALFILSILDVFNPGGDELIVNLE